MTKTTTERAIAAREKRSRAAAAKRGIGSSEALDEHLAELEGEAEAEAEKPAKAAKAKA